jgi:hypothetical protein
MHGNSKLTEREVKEIRRKRKEKPHIYSIRKLASKYGRSLGCIHNLINFKSHKTVQ